MSSHSSVYIKTISKLCFNITRMDEDSKIFLVLLGFMATTLSPFLVLWYMFHCTTFVISQILIPIVGVAIMLFVGLPLICVLRWIYGTYDFLYSVLMNFFCAAISFLTFRDAGVRKYGRKHRPTTAAEMHIVSK